MRIFLLIMIGVCLQNYAQASDYSECVEEQIYIVQENAEGKSADELLEEILDIPEWCEEYKK